MSKGKPAMTRQKPGRKLEYTPQIDAWLKEHYEKGFEVEAMAKVLGRTAHGLRDRLGHLGVKRPKKYRTLAQARKYDRMVPPPGVDFRADQPPEPQRGWKRRCASDDCRKIFESTNFNQLFCDGCLVALSEQQRRRLEIRARVARSRPAPRKSDTKTFSWFGQS